MVKVVSTWGNQKAKSGGMGRVFPIFFGTLRRISDLTNLAVTSWNISCFLNPGLYGKQMASGDARDLSVTSQQIGTQSLKDRKSQCVVGCCGVGVVALDTTPSMHLEKKEGGGTIVQKR